VVVRDGDRVVAWTTVSCGDENPVADLEMRASAGTPGRLDGVGL